MGKRMMSAAVTILCSISLFAQQHSPNVFLMNPSTILAARESYGKPGGEFKAAIDALLGDAHAALESEPVSVVQKSEIPPSGDKHDYMSVAPYWWPDTTKPWGVPYVRRDGERKPEYYALGDHMRMGKMISDVRTLALAYFISRHENFAEKAVVQLQAWFVHAATRMNPNLNFAQAVKGYNEGRGIGIIDTYGFRDVIDAIQLLQGSQHWTRQIDRGMKEWFSAYLKWLQESPNGKEEAAEKNNHGSAYDVQVASIALYLGKNDIAREVVLSARTRRIPVQIQTDGSQPLELARTKSWGYTLMNTEALMNLALLGEHVGVDLWHYAAEDGRGIQKAIDFLVPYALNEKEWTWKQIIPMERERMYPILKIAAVRYGEAKYRTASETLLSPSIKASRFSLVLPSSTPPKGGR